MGEFSVMHWLVIGVIALLFFGPSRVEGLGKSLGRSIRGFKEGMNEIDAEVKPVPPDSQKQINQAQADASAGQTQSQPNKETQRS